MPWPIITAIASLQQHKKLVFSSIPKPDGSFLFSTFISATFVILWNFHLFTSFSFLKMCSCIFGSQQANGRGKLRCRAWDSYLQRIIPGLCTSGMGHVLVSYLCITIYHTFRLLKLNPFIIIYYYHLFFFNLHSLDLGSALLGFCSGPHKATVILI